MGMLRRALLKVRALVWPSFTDDDVLEASTENIMREHDQAVQQIKEVTASREVSNQKLRQTLDRAKIISSTFGDFERAIRKEPRHHVGR